MKHPELMNSPDDTTSSDYIPDLPERYTLIKKLGEGGNSSVYQAIDSLLQKEVAIKILTTDSKSAPKKIVNFQREARITAQLKHHNIVSIRDFGLTDSGQPYLVMDYVSGESLADVLSRSGRIAVQDSMPLIYEILAAVKYAHSQGVLHRDLKPSNILIADNPDDEAVVKLIDFGIARMADPGQQTTGSGGLHGTPAFMSPEQARGRNIDERSEIYSLGCILFTIWTGRPPFEAEITIELLNMHCEKQPPRLNDIDLNNGTVRVISTGEKAFSEELESIVAKCLNKNANNRIQSVEQLALELQKVEGGDVANAITSDTNKKNLAVEIDADKPQKQKQNPLAIASIALLVLLVVVVGSLFTLSSLGPQEKTPSATPKEPDKPIEIERNDRNNALFKPPIDDIEFKKEWFIKKDKSSGERTLTTSTTYPLADEELKEIGDRTDYVKLKLRNHRMLTGEGLCYIKNPKLQTLDIANAQLTEKGCQAIAGLKTLQDLDVGESATFKGEYLKYLLELPLLTHVQLPVQNIKPADIAVLRKHPALKMITLFGNNAKESAIVEELVKLKHLQRLGFTRCNLTPKDIAPLSKLQSPDLIITEGPVPFALMSKIADLPLRSVRFSGVSQYKWDDLILLRKSKTILEISLTNSTTCTPSELAWLRKQLAPRVMNVF